MLSTSTMSEMRGKRMDEPSYFLRVLPRSTASMGKVHADPECGFSAATQRRVVLRSRRLSPGRVITTARSDWTGGKGWEADRLSVRLSHTITTETFRLAPRLWQ